MNLVKLLAHRAEAGKPVRAGLIAPASSAQYFFRRCRPFPVWKFRRSPISTRSACQAVGWEEGRIAATRFIDSGHEVCTGDGARWSLRNWQIAIDVAWTG